MIPITAGVIPFGAIVGTVCSEAQFSFLQTMGMNLFVYAGASQLAATELMMKNTTTLIVVLTGLIINLRFLLYSAAMSPFVQKSSLVVKMASSYLLTDQSYATMTAHQEYFKTSSDAVRFYFGGALCMNLVWHASVAGGFAFGNFAPAAWALDFAVPLSFVALVIPTLKSRKYVLVAVFSSIVSVILHTMPYRTGLIITALLSIGLAALITRKKASS